MIWIFVQRTTSSDVLLCRYLNILSTLPRFICTSTEGNLISVNKHVMSWYANDNEILLEQFSCCFNCYIWESWIPSNDMVVNVITKCEFQSNKTNISQVTMANFMHVWASLSRFICFRLKIAETNEDGFNLSMLPREI